MSSFPTIISTHEIRTYHNLHCYVIKCMQKLLMLNCFPNGHLFTCHEINPVVTWTNFLMIVNGGAFLFRIIGQIHPMLFNFGLLWYIVLDIHVVGFQWISLLIPIWKTSDITGQCDSSTRQSSGRKQISISNSPLYKMKLKSVGFVKA